LALFISVVGWTSELGVVCEGAGNMGWMEDSYWGLFICIQVLVKNIVMIPNVWRGRRWSTTHWHLYKSKSKDK
jgi:hypothetical protein